MLNARELATLSWLLVGAAFVLYKAPTRHATLNVLQAAKHWKIPTPLAGMVVWIAILCALGSSFGIWEWDLAKDSAVWFVVAGLAMFYTASQPSQQRGLFRRALRGAVTATALVELYIGLLVFPFLVELAVQPVLFLLIGMSVVAATRQEFAPAKRIVTQSSRRSASRSSCM